MKGYVYREDYVYMAEAIAREAHKGQKRFEGEPYIIHPERVVNSLDTDDEKTVAWLHDVLEDTDLTYDDLVRLGIPTVLCIVVKLLTRPKDLNYDIYLEGIMSNTLAIKVKLFDIEDNINDRPTKAMRHKYILAKYILEKYLLLR